MPTCLGSSYCLVWQFFLPLQLYHTAGLDTIFIQIYMDGPQGVPGVSKEQEGHKDQHLEVFLH